MDGPTRYLRPTAPASDRAVVVGDPGRALLLAQSLIEPPPPMFNHHRGFWGYSGASSIDGDRLVVQGTGLGATSTNAVVGDLLSLGVERIVRVGTCTALEGLEPGGLLVVTAARGLDGVSKRLAGADAPLLPDASLTASLESHLGDSCMTGTVESGDLAHFGSGEPAGPGSPGGGPVAADLATGSLFATAAAGGARAAAVLVAAHGTASSLDDDRLEGLFRAAGLAAVAALAAH